MSIYDAWVKSMNSGGTGTPDGLFENKETCNLYSLSQSVMNENVENRQSLRSLLANIYHVVQLQNALRALEAEGVVVGSDELVPLSYGGVAVLDYSNPEDSVIPAEFDRSMPQVLNTETLIMHSSIAQDNGKGSIGPMGER